MSYESTQDDSVVDTNTFYRRTLHVLSDARVPFLVGGSHAYLHFTGIVRNTKDLDLFLKREDVERALRALEGAGYRTELTFPHWLGKAFYADNFVDLVYASGNGVARIDDAWFEHSIEAEVLGMPVRLTPPEEFLWQKSFVMERERFDGADICHLLRCQADRMDWNRLVARYDGFWHVLLMYLTLFAFVYPSERGRIPPQVFTDLLGRMQQEVNTPAPDDPLCRGTLLSRMQYLLDVGRYGYRDARIALGTMTPEEVVYWTWAIGNIE